MDVLTFVEHVHPHRLDDETREVIEALAAPRPGTATECLEDADIPLSTASWRLRKRQLPAAVYWRRLGRGLRVTSYLARHPEMSESQAARALGYADHAAVHHAARRAFGLPLAVARQQPRLQLIARWWHRQEATATTATPSHRRVQTREREQ